MSKFSKLPRRRPPPSSPPKKIQWALILKAPTNALGMTTQGEDHPNQVKSHTHKHNKRQSKTYKINSSTRMKCFHNSLRLCSVFCLTRSRSLAPPRMELTTSGSTVLYQLSHFGLTPAERNTGRHFRCEIRQVRCGYPPECPMWHKWTAPKLMANIFYTRARDHGTCCHCRSKKAFLPSV